MTNNEYRQQYRSRVNKLKREIAAMRTEAINAKIKTILANPTQMEFLALLAILWDTRRRENIPGKTQEDRAVNRTLLALDEALEAFNRNTDLLSTPDTEYIKNAEAPFAALPPGWSHAATCGSSDRFPILPLTTWKYVFFKDGVLTAGFESRADAIQYLDYIDHKTHQKSIQIADLTQLTKKEAATPGLFIKRKDGLNHFILRKINGNAYPIKVMPPMTPLLLEEKLVDRILATLNTAAEEVEQYWANSQK